MTTQESYHPTRPDKERRPAEPFGVRVVENRLGLGFALGDQDFWIGEGDVAAGSVHIAFAAPDRETVNAFHAAAVDAGGVDTDDPGFVLTITRGTTPPSSSTPKGTT